jgi:hypothetical protein
MSRGDEARRLIRMSQRLATWASVEELIEVSAATRRTVNRILAGLHEEVGLVKRRVGRRIEYRLTTRAERAEIDRQ